MAIMSDGESEWIDFRLRGNDIYFESHIYATMPRGNDIFFEYHLYATNPRENDMAHDSSFHTTKPYY